MPKSPGKTARPRKTAGRFRIKRVYEPADKDDGLRVLVDRLWPRGIAKKKAHIDLWLRDLSPSDALRRMVHADPAKWDEFVKAYGRELKQEPARTAFADLRKLPRSRPVTLLYAAPVFYFVFFVIFVYGLFFAVAGAREGFDDAGGRATFITVLTALWALALFVTLLFLARRIRDARIPEEPEAFPLAPHFVRLFDDAALSRAGDGRRFFPAEDRPLLKLWWEGSGKLFLRSRRYQIELSFDGAAVAQVVPAPLVPMTPAEYGQLLTATVRDGAGTIGHLKAEVAFAGDPAVQLPPGADFADGGDDAEGAEAATVSAHDAEAAKFHQLGTNAAGAFLLRHAPRSAQAMRFGAFGPVPSADEAATVDRERREGYLYVADGRVDVPGETIMDYAADVAAVLCLGAVPKLADSRVQPTLVNRRSAAGAAVAPEVGPVGQVFRNWCLDRRRLNEWRMLVAGGALSEKGGHPERPDPAMPRPIDADWHPDPAVAGGEAAANVLGWVPLLRQWIGTVAAGGDPLDETLHPNGWKNRELSQAVAFLFDLPQPVRLAP